MTSIYIRVLTNRAVLLYPPFEGNASTDTIRNHEYKWNNKKLFSRENLVKSDPPPPPYIPTVPIPTTPAVVVGSCPDERWRKYGADCFLFRPDESFTWKNAADQCVTEGGPRYGQGILTNVSVAKVSIRPPRYAPPNNNDLIFRWFKRFKVIAISPANIITLHPSRVEDIYQMCN